MTYYAIVNYRSNVFIAIFIVSFFHFRAFEGLLDVHHDIQGFDSDCRPLSEAYASTAAPASSLTLSPSDEALSGAVSRVETTDTTSAFPPPVNGSSNQTERKSISLITVLLSYLKDMDRERKNQSADGVGTEFLSGRLQLQAVTVLVQLLDRYEGDAVPVVLGIYTGNSNGCNRVDGTGRPIRPPNSTRSTQAG